MNEESTNMFVVWVSRAVGGAQRLIHLPPDFISARSPADAARHYLIKNDLDEDQREWTLVVASLHGEKLHTYRVSLKWEVEEIEPSNAKCLIETNHLPPERESGMPSQAERADYVKLRASIREILENRGNYVWTLQGFGMLRTFPFAGNETTRLHVWSLEDAVRGVSTIHDHPWDFTSTVISGEIRNVRYRIALEGTSFWTQAIRCGAGGGLIYKPRREYLRKMDEKLHRWGPHYRYSQPYDEIHESIPSDGAVTLVERSFRDRRDLAHVPEEVERIVGRALDKWS